MINYIELLGVLYLAGLFPAFCFFSTLFSDKEKPQGWLEALGDLWIGAVIVIAYPITFLISIALTIVEIDEAIKYLLKEKEKE